jgi:endo-1,4-beta-xylanase
VNEAVEKDGKLRKDTLWNRIGKSGRYIEVAFRAARKADPKIALFYNDYGTEDINPKSDGVYKLLSGLKAKGVPIDGIGFQMHLDYHQNIDLGSVRRNFARFAKLGLKIHITEFDYKLPEKPSAAQLDQEARAYHDFAELCVSTPACEAFLSWGFTDAHSWIPAFYPGFGNALYFDKDYNKKAAYFGLYRGLARQKGK